MKKHLISLFSSIAIMAFSGCTTTVPDSDPGPVMMAESSIANFEYFPESQVLHAHFKTGSYEYRNVPLKTFEAIQEAESAGKAFNELIKGTYPGVLVEK